jgi:hypothetical protein
VLGLPVPAEMNETEFSCYVRCSKKTLELRTSESGFFGRFSDCCANHATAMMNDFALIVMFSFFSQFAKSSKSVKTSGIRRAGEKS